MSELLQIKTSFLYYLKAAKFSFFVHFLDLNIPYKMGLGTRPFKSIARVHKLQPFQAVLHMTRLVFIQPQPLPDLIGSDPSNHALAEYISYDPS